MAQEATANEQKKFKVPRIPGDIMIYPMIVGLLDSWQGILNEQLAHRLGS